MPHVCGSRQTMTKARHKLIRIGAKKGASCVPWQGVMFKTERLAKISDAEALAAP